MNALTALGDEAPHLTPSLWAAVWLVLCGPLLLGLVALYFPPRRMLTLVAAYLPVMAATGWLIATVATSGPRHGVLSVGELTLTWYLDGLATLLLLLTQTVLMASAVFAAGYCRVAELPSRPAAWLWPLLGGLSSGLTLIWVAADLLSLYVGLEAMGLCAVALMLLPGEAEALAAGMRYLLYTLVGSLAWLLGVSLLLSAWGRLDLAGLAAVVEPGAVITIAVALLSAGLLLKASIFPLHAWLAPVHGAAWTPVSAVHAALVIKASFVILLKLWVLLVPGQVAAAWFLGGLGGLAVLWGGILAWRAQGLKELVAFSTVGQLGYLMLAFPLLIGTSEAVAALAWRGTWLHLAGHALAKAAMFMAVGSLVLSTGRSQLAELAGTSRRLPLPLLTFGLAAVTLMGLPPSAGFTAKWLLLQAAMRGEQWLWIGVLVLGTMLTAAYLFRMFRHSFDEQAPHLTYRRLPLGMDMVALLLALAALALGLVADWPLGLLRPWGGSS